VTDGDVITAAHSKPQSEMPRRDRSGTLRLALATTFPITLVAAVITDSAAPPGVGMLAWALFWGVGVGSAPWQLNERLRSGPRLLLSGMTALGVSCLGGSMMVLADAWHPRIGLVVVELAAAVMHVRAALGLLGATAKNQGLSSSRTEPQSFVLLSGVEAKERPRHHAPRLTFRHPSLWLTAGGLVLCLAAALAHRHLDPGYFGFLTKVGPAWYIGLAAVLCAFLLARPDSGHESAAAVWGLMLVLTLTPSIVYDGARSQSAGKHLELVQQILVSGHVRSAIAIYDYWPGFFAGVAWIVDPVHAETIVSLAPAAIFWPPLLGCLRVAALRCVFGGLSLTPRQAWVATALAVLADSIGADYFSPQAVGFVLGLGVFGLALRGADVLPGAGLRARSALLTAAGCTLAVTHQLSPYVIGGGLIVLVVFRLVRPWWTPACVLVPAVIWAVINYGTLKSFLSFGQVGDIHNLRPPKIAGPVVLSRSSVVTDSVIALTSGILLLGLLALLTLIRRRRSPMAWGLAVTPAAGLLLVVANPYGQEGIFRASLFGIPWLAALAAQNFADRPSLRSRAGLAAVSGLMVVTFLVSAFGLDIIYTVRKPDLAVLQLLDEQVDRTGGYVLLNLGAGDLPTSIRAGTVIKVSREALNQPVRQVEQLDAGAQEVALTEGLLRFAGSDRSAVFAIWSPVQADYALAYGLQTPDQFRALRDAFTSAPYWKIRSSDGGTVLFQLDPSKLPAGIR